MVTITTESDWQALFSTPAETQEFLLFLISLSGNNNAASQSKISPSNAALKAVQIQTCAYLLSQPWLANASPDFVQGTFKLIFDSVNDNNL